MIDASFSLKVKILSAVALFFVVLQHSSPAVEDASVAGRIWRDAVAYGIADYPVSFFFILSGFFLAQNLRCGWWIRAVGKRIRSLVIPYLVWCLIGWGVLWQFQKICWLDVWGITNHLPILESLWYVKVLFVLVLVSLPFVWLFNLGRVSSKVRIGAWISLCLVLATLCLFRNLPAQKTVIFSSLYFCLGILIATNMTESVRLMEWLRGKRNVLMVLCGLLILLKCVCGIVMRTPETFLRWYLVPACIVTTWVLYDTVAEKTRMVAILSKRPIFRTMLSGTFFVYCCQDLVMKLLVSGVPAWGVHGFGCPTVIWSACSLAISVYMISIVLFFACRFAAPKAYELLSGGR